MLCNVVMTFLIDATLCTHPWFAVGIFRLRFRPRATVPLLAQRLRKELEQALPEQLGPLARRNRGSPLVCSSARSPDPARRLEALREMSSQDTFENFLQTRFPVQIKGVVVKGKVYLVGAGPEIPNFSP